MERFNKLTERRRERNDDIDCEEKKNIVYFFFLFLFINFNSDTISATFWKERDRSLNYYVTK